MIQPKRASRPAPTKLRYRVKIADRGVDYSRNWLVMPARYTADGMAVAACYTREFARRICRLLNQSHRKGK